MHYVARNILKNKAADKLAARFQIIEPRWEKFHKKSHRHFLLWRQRWRDLRIIKQNRPLPHDTNLEVLLWVDAETAGNSLGLTAKERSMWKITTIRACDQTPEEAAAVRKANKRKTQRARRRAKGGMSRNQYLAENKISKLKPWEEMGISRRTYYRQLAQVRPVAQVRGDHLYAYAQHAPVPKERAEASTPMSGEKEHAFPFAQTLDYLVRLSEYRRLTRH